jgi:hypothetical protein
LRRRPRLMGGSSVSSGQGTLAPRRAIPGGTAFLRCAGWRRSASTWTAESPMGQASGYRQMSDARPGGEMSKKTLLIPSWDCEDCRFLAQWIERDHPVGVRDFGATVRVRANNAQLCDRCHCRRQADEGINEWIAASQGRALWACDRRLRVQQLTPWRDFPHSWGGGPRPSGGPPGCKWTRSLAFTVWHRHCPVLRMSAAPLAAKDGGRRRETNGGARRRGTGSPLQGRRGRSSVSCCASSSAPLSASPRAPGPAPTPAFPRLCQNPTRLCARSSPTNERSKCVAKTPGRAAVTGRATTSPG